MRLLKTALIALGHFLWIVVLTLLTQVGGLLWLLALVLSRFLHRKWPVKGLVWLVFIFLYTASSIVIIPPVARQYGRVPLPVFSNPHLRPENLWFCLLNRHYVRPGLRLALEDVAQHLQARFPETPIWYLDANFPFFDGYPMEPHFSHRDGKKVDLSIYWQSTESGALTQGNPSPFGYGVYAEPLPGERDYTRECFRQGYWYIGLEGKLAAPFFRKENYRFDQDRTRELLRLLTQNPAIRRILIQPHLKQRLGLAALNKLRFQGCRAARHDDHAHVELR